MTKIELNESLLKKIDHEQYLELLFKNNLTARQALMVHLVDQIGNKQADVAAMFGTSSLVISDLRRKAKLKINDSQCPSELQ